MNYKPKESRLMYLKNITPYISQSKWRNESGIIKSHTFDNFESLETNAN